MNKLTFTGKLETFISINKLTDRYDYSYYSNAEDILSFNGEIGVAVFENSNFDVIFRLRRKRADVPIILVDDRFSKSRKREYESLKVDVLSNICELPDKIKDYISKK